MKILDRYIVRQFLATFVLLVFALPFLFLITDLTDSLDRYLARGLPMRSVAVSYVYYLPQLLFWSFPIAALVATVFAIGNMTRHQEITAAKAGGVSFLRLSLPIFVLGALLSVAAVGLGELVPVANQLRSEALGERERLTSPFRMNFVFRTENGRTLSASRVNAEAAEMTNVVIERTVDGAGLHVHHAASQARWEPESGWRLEDGYLRWIQADGEEVTFAFANLRVNDLDEDPEDLLVLPKEADEMRYAELERFIRTLERSGGTASAERVHLAQKVALPMAVLVIVLFGAPLATTSQRGGTAFGIGISLAVTMVYLMLFKVGEAIGASGAIHPMIAAWAPNGIFLVTGLVFLWRVRT
jgi:lipopolysaccharide export system permease protein